MRGCTWVALICLFVVCSNTNDVHGFHLLGVPFLAGRPKFIPNTQKRIGPKRANIQIVPLIEINDAKMSIRPPSRRSPWKIRLHRQRRGEGKSAVEDTLLNSFLRSTPLNVTELDPWGIYNEQSHLHIPSWVLTSESETRHLAAMKIVLEQDLEELNRKTLTTLDGRTIKVAKAFPDVYGDLRMLRFLRKDKIQDPVTAAVRYRQFLRWRTENQVDQIRLQFEERLRLGDKDPFRPPSDWQIVDECLPFHLVATRAKDALVPIHVHVEQWDIPRLTNIVRNGREGELSLKEFFGYWIYIFEALNFHLYHESVRTKQMVFADIHCDLKGLKLGQVHAAFISRILGTLIRTAQSYYPETTKAIHFSRPSKLFSFAWTVLSPIVKKGTVGKFSIDRSSDTGCPDLPTSASSG